MIDKMPMGVRFSILSRAFKREVDQLLKEKGLTAVQFGVLGELGKLEDSGLEEVNQKDLENAAHVTHPTMTGILSRLQKQGFVNCRASSIDKRRKAVSSTEKATALMQELDDMDKAVFLRFCKGMSPEQIESLSQLSKKMLENVFETSCCKGGSKVV